MLDETTGAASRTPPGFLPATLALLAIAVYGVSLGHGFVGDDAHIIVGNPRVHALQPVWDYLRQSYWPSEYGGGLYRPLTIASFAIQFRLGHGGPFLFHLVSLLLFAIIAVQVWRLARMFVSPASAWFAGAVFAVHPVHVEAVANVVGQSELVVASLHLLAVTWYITLRRRETIGWQGIAGLGALYLLSCFAKESGIVLPGLFLVADAVCADGRSLSARVRGAWPLYAVLTAIGLVFWAGRAVVLGGFVGETPTIAIRGVSTGTRLLTMLAVVPQWWRLLLFPWHLQADYLPVELDRATGFDGAQLLGVLCLLGWVVGGWVTRRRAPLVAFGLAWAAVALFPVSNLVVPVGVLLAERTLFSPSVGICLSLGGAATLLQQGRPGFRRLASAVAALMVVVGAWRSADRTTVWHDDERLIRQTVLDAPLSYHAHALLGRVLFDQGDARAGEQEFLTALRLYPHDPEIHAALGQRYRIAGLYQPAIPLFRQALRLAPHMTPVRNMLIYCLLQIGDSAGAAEELAEKFRRGDPDAPVIRARIDSVLRIRSAERPRP